MRSTYLLKLLLGFGAIVALGGCDYVSRYGQILDACHESHGATQRSCDDFNARNKEKADAARVARDARKTADAELRWIYAEIKQARLDEQNPPAEYPGLAWMNGVWCLEGSIRLRDPVSRRMAQRFKVIDGNTIRETVYFPQSDAIGNHPAYITETIKSIRANGRVYELISAKSFSDRKESYSTYLRRENNNQFTKIKFDQFVDGKLRHTNKRNDTYTRCTGIP